MNENIRKTLKRVFSPQVIRNVLAVIMLVAVEAGLAYMGFVFFKTDFLVMWFRILLIVSDVLFMLGLLWLVRRYVIS
ncbi:MAG: hypothetical protein J5744_05650 [Oscillospiraceae bacterium]|nr:hypothetical protein [Oscillospiraceae bacterium]